VARLELKFNATILAQMVHFILLLILLRLVAYKPILRILEERQKYIAANIEAAEQQRLEAERIREQFEAEMRRAREKADEIIQQATRAGEEQARQIIAQAREEATRLKESALQEIQMERERAMAELKEQVANLSVLVAGRILKETITMDTQRRLVREFIDEAARYVQ